MITCRPTGRAARCNSASTIRTSSADSTFGSMTPSGGVGCSTIASRSLRPNGVRMPLMRTTRSMRSARAPSNRGMERARASSLCAGITASSRSTVTMSGPAASAFANRSGRVPGTNSRLRRGWIVSVIGSRPARCAASAASSAICHRAPRSVQGRGWCKVVGAGRSGGHGSSRTAGSEAPRAVTCLRDATETALSAGMLARWRRARLHLGTPPEQVRSSGRKMRRAKMLSEWRGIAVAARCRILRGSG